jgi:hypothetical protein
VLGISTEASMYHDEAAHTTCHVQNRQTPVRRVTTPSILPVKATRREGRRITGYHIFPKHLLETPTRISEDANCAIREIILNFPRKQKLSTDCRALRTVYSAGAPRKRRWFDTPSSPACPLLAAASGQGHHVVPKHQAKTPRESCDGRLEATADAHS